MLEQEDKRPAPVAAGAGLSESIENCGSVHFLPHIAAPTIKTTIEAAVPPTCEAEASLEFLDLAYPNRDRTLVAIQPQPDGSVNTRARTFRHDEADALKQWLHDLNSTGFNIYFAVNPLKAATTKKAMKKDVAGAEWLFVDIDPRAGEEIEKERARIRDQLFAYNAPSPSFVIDSGGGFQALWRLAKTHEVDGDGPLTQMIESYGIKLEMTLGADRCHNIDRVLRVPGTVNWPDERKRKKGRKPALARLLVSEPGRQYDLDAFPVPTPVAAIEPTTLPAPRPIRGLDELAPYELPRWAYMNIKHGADVDALNRAHREFGGPAADSPYPSRSEPLLAAVCEMVRRAVPDDLILGVILDPNYGISASVREKRNALKYAQRQLVQAKEMVAREIITTPMWPDVGQNNVVRPTYRNALEAIKALGVKCEKNLFKGRMYVASHLIGTSAKELSDDVLIVLRTEIVNRFGFDPRKEHVRDAAHQLCLEGARDPVLDYIDGTTWDGQPRLDSWLCRYLGAEDNTLNRAIGRKMLLAAVRRVRRPGCKFDYIPVFEGEQGSGKSTALEILAGGDYFSDQSLLGQSEREQQESVGGVWIYELAELAGLRRADIDKVKAFASRTRDRARPAYGYQVVDQPRRCIFVGTTNNAEYLQDATGNRRFWPVRTGIIDLDGLRRDRDQLWAEAAAAEAAGESLTLPDELWPEVTARQDDRMVHDPWIDALEKVTGRRSGDEVRISSEYLLTEVLGLLRSQQNDGASKRLARAMKSLGWHGPEKIRIDGRSMRGYRRQVRPDDEQPVPPEPGRSGNAEPEMLPF